MKFKITLKVTMPGAMPAGNGRVVLGPMTDDEFNAAKAELSNAGFTVEEVGREEVAE